MDRTLALPLVLLTSWVLHVGMLHGLATAEAAADRFDIQIALGLLQLEAGQSAHALQSLQLASDSRPQSAAARFDLALALLASGMNEDAQAEAMQAASLDAGLQSRVDYLSACTELRRREWRRALHSLQAVAVAHPQVAAVHFQLAWARDELGEHEGALTAYREALRLEPEHPAAHYRLAQSLVRKGAVEEARSELAVHRRLLAARAPRQGALLPGRATYEACLLLRPIRPDPVLNQPAAEGVPIRFVARASDWPRPDHTRASGTLSADLDNDQLEDLVEIGPDGLRVLRGTAGGSFADTTTASGLAGAGALGGVLVDLDHSSTVDLICFDADGARYLRNQGAATFVDATEEFGLPARLDGITRLRAADWDGDDLTDLIIARDGMPMLLYTNAGAAAGARRLTPATVAWPIASSFTVGDVDGDLQLDLVMLVGDSLLVQHRDGSSAKIAGGLAPGVPISLLDMDNDGWLDLMTGGTSLRAWRNLGAAGFVEVTDALALGEIEHDGAIVEIRAADLDADGDLDVLLGLADSGFAALENRGGNANHSLSLRLHGKRSSSSGVGARVEVYCEGLRSVRIAGSEPLVFGLGQRTSAALVNVVWLDQTDQILDIAATDGAVVGITEPTIMTTSCPYLFAWDGTGFRFVNDLLGGSPLGLPLSDRMLVPADPDELVWVGRAQDVPPRAGYFELRITEELREVTYLDQAVLVVADHPADIAVECTDKLCAPPFPPSELVTLARPRALRAACDADEKDLLATLAQRDGAVSSPARLLATQLPGMAEPHSVILDFGPLEVERPLVLALTGWLRYGGATGNLAAAAFPGLGNPTPRLEVETGDGEWQAVDTVVGMPAGKTKTILVDLAGRLPIGARRLRLSTSFELRWDCALLYERDPTPIRISRLLPERAELRYHGHGEIVPTGEDQPVISYYDRLRPVPPWHWIPAGLFTSYGDVLELVTALDDRLALIGSGDEVALSFPAAALPALPAGWQRDLFIYTVGWDKDSDPHTLYGRTVEPLPFHGMDDQRYGEESRPASLPTEWIRRYNTRVVPERVPGSQW